MSSIRSPRRGDPAPPPLPAPSAFPAPGGPAPGVPIHAKSRTRPLAAVGLVAITLVGIVATQSFVASQKHTVPVVAVAVTVPQGSAITRADLTIAQGKSDPALALIPASRIDGIVGEYATTTLFAGQSLTTAGFTASPLPAKGQSVVGLQMKTGTMPGEPLNPGDTVDLFQLPDPTSNAVPLTAPAAIQATVVDETTDKTSGSVVVDVTVPSASAGLLAMYGAAGRIAMTLDARAH